MNRITTSILFLCISLMLYSQSGGRYIVIDQFGYPNNAKKTAVIRDPQIGFDAEESYDPGTVFSVIEVSSGDAVYTNVIQEWKNGTTDESSGVAFRFFGCQGNGYLFYIG
ncbi:cellulase N-terminal Ig-like domain-containing protein [Bacteroidota bacterium]